MNNENLNSGLNPGSVYRSSGSKADKLPLIFVIILVLVLLATSVAWGFKNKSQADDSRTALLRQEDESRKLKKELDERKTTTGEENINKDQYQAVFLSSGQVYFGKITKITETQLTLESIFYLREENDQSLVKLGKEIHGPEDKMFIERNIVEFYENLKPDSEVSKAIKEYEAANP